MTTKGAFYAFNSITANLDERETHKRSNSLFYLLSAWMRESASTLQSETKAVNNVRPKIEAGLMDNRAGH